jgi:hypothetical protein
MRGSFFLGEEMSGGSHDSDSRTENSVSLPVPQPFAIVRAASHNAAVGAVR